MEYDYLGGLDFGVFGKRKGPQCLRKMLATSIKAGLLFGVTPSDLEGLDHQVRLCHGNPYKVYKRDEVEQRARERKGSDTVQATLTLKKLSEVNSRLSSIEYEKARLMVEKKEYEDIIRAAGMPVPGEAKANAAAEKKKKEPAKKRKRTAKAEDEE